MLDLVSFMELPLINDSTRIYVHTGDDVGVICGDPHYEYFFDYYHCIVDSFLWFNYNECHVYLQLMR